MNKTIFKNKKIEVIFLSLDSKKVIVNLTGTDKSAGWLSKTWYLHSFAKTPAYIFEQASEEVHKNIFVIAENLLSHVQKLYEDFIKEWQEKEKDKTEFTVEINGRKEPLYGMADIFRYNLKQLKENLELIKDEIENTKFKKLPKGNFNNNIRRVSR
jgi:hypothetical protein